MRYKDEAKQVAINKATVKLVNQIGFVASSVSKIANEAKVSPATIYIYYKNKEDLLVSTYVDIKQKLSAAILEDFDDTQPIRDIMKDLWRKTLEYISRYPENFLFTEQFSNSPYASLIDKKEVDKYFEPLMKVVQKGIEQKIIKNVGFEILAAFMLSPIITLSYSCLSANLDLDEKNFETAFNMAWDAIKL